MDTPGSVQFIKSESYDVLINLELRYRCRLRRETDLIPGLLSRGPNRHVDESWHDQDDSPQNVEIVSSTSVEQSHAVASHAPKPQAQSSLMNYPSKEFIQIDKRKWNDISACDAVERNSLDWKISKRLTVLVRHQDIDNRDIDGAIHWSSLYPRLRRDFEREGGRTFSDSQWLGYIHRGSNKPRFQCCVQT